MEKKVKVPVKKLTETKIKEYLTHNDKVNPSVTSSMGEEETKTTITWIGGSDYVSFKYKTYAFCCGMKEIGDIILLVNGDLLPDNLIRDLVTKMLRQVIKKFTFEDDTPIVDTKYGLTFTVPVNVEGHSSNYTLFIEAALKVGFVEIGEFINHNSSNTLKHFVLI